MAVEDAELAMARDFWAAGDLSYKNAVQRYRAKLAARDATASAERPPDWSAKEPVVDVRLARFAAPDEQLLRRIAVEASAVLWELPGLDAGEVASHGAEVSREGEVD